MIGPYLAAEQQAASVPPRRPVYATDQFVEGRLRTGFHAGEFLEQPLAVGRAGARGDHHGLGRAADQSHPVPLFQRGVDSGGCGTNQPLRPAARVIGVFLLPRPGHPAVRPGVQHDDQPGLTQGDHLSDDQFTSARGTSPVYPVVVVALAVLANADELVRILTFADHADRPGLT